MANAAFPIPRINGRLAKRVEVKEETIRRFMSKVTEFDSGCWMWDVNSTGFFKNHRTQFVINSKKYVACRASWELFNSDIPAGLFVCHHCDEPRCVNPKHLFLGTCKDNMQDCARKGRNIFQKIKFTGKSNGRGKLSNEDVIEIKRLISEGKKAKEVALKFNVSHKHVSNVARGRFRSVLNEN